MNTLDRYNNDGPIYQAVLGLMGRRGVSVDANRIAELANSFQASINTHEREVMAASGKMVNLNSTSDIRDLFYERRGGEWVDRMDGQAPIKMTDGGTTDKMPSVDESVLEHFERMGSPIAKNLLQYRFYTKLYGTYIKRLPEYMDGNSRVHPSLSQMARTGRLTCRDPNLQNQPARSDQGKLVRQLFRAGKWGDVPDYLCLDEVYGVPFVHNFRPDQPMRLIVADYDQVELKLTAHISRDPTMLDVILKGRDLHCVTAANNARIRGLPYTYDDFYRAKKAKDPTEEEKKLVSMRSAGKSVSFGIVYGIGPVGLGAQLDLPVVKKQMRNGRIIAECPDGQELIDNFFALYPGVRAAIEASKEFGREHGYVTTITGRRRRLPDLSSSTRFIAEKAGRQAFNTEVQGSAADVAQAVMIAIELDPELRALGVRQLLQVHDELIFEVPDIPEIVERAKARIKYRMENPFVQPLLVPLTTSGDDAYTWGDAK